MNAQDPLTFEERGGMTVHMDSINVQMRNIRGEETMALHVKAEAQYSVHEDDVVVLNGSEVDKLRELLNEAERRESEHSNNDTNIPES